jgi:hypothetical protein
LGERTTANGLEHATRRRLGTTGSTRLGWGSGTSPARHDDEFQLWSTTATAVSSGGEGENKEGVRGGARAGRGRGLGVQFIEEGGDERSASVMPLKAFKELELRRTWEEKKQTREHHNARINGCSLECTGGWWLGAGSWRGRVRRRRVGGWCGPARRLQTRGVGRGVAPGRLGFARGAGRPGLRSGRVLRSYSGRARRAWGFGASWLGRPWGRGAVGARLGVARMAGRVAGCLAAGAGACWRSWGCFRQVAAAREEQGEERRERRGAAAAVAREKGAAARSREAGSGGFMGLMGLGLGFVWDQKEYAEGEVHLPCLLKT